MISSKSSDEFNWRGIKIQSIEKLFEGTFGESSNGRIRVKLYAQKRNERMKAQLLNIFKYTSKVELLVLFKSSNEEHFRFEFYCKSENYLYYCINPDGLCGPRNFAALQKGMLLNSFSIIPHFYFDMLLNLHV